MKHILTMILIGYSIQGSAETFDESVNCLARNVYFEARGQTLIGQYAVAQVTLNRVKHGGKYPNTVCKVVYQPKQFSWTIKGKERKTKNIIAWEIAYAIALDSLKNKKIDITKGAVFYHAKYASPKKWMKEKTRVAIIEGHIFYR